MLPRRLRAALGLLTSIGGSAAPEVGAAVWFGPVGALVGAAVAGAWWLGDVGGAPLVGAGLAVAVDLALTGLLHVDGLADSADGLLPPLPRERRLAIMRQPDTGAFGVATVVVVLLLRWSALASMPPALVLVAVVWALSRGAMAATMAVVPAARRDSLAAPFAARRPGLTGAGVALALSAVLVGVGSVGAGGTFLHPGQPESLVGGALATLAGFCATVALAWRRIGGYSGDVLGAAGMVGETTGLAVAALLR